MASSFLKRRNMLCGLVAAGGAAALATLDVARAAADDDEVKLDKVPDIVKKTADKAVPGAKWTTAFKDKEEDKDVYELHGTDDKGRNIEVEVFADGMLIKVQKEIPIKEVPKVAMKAVEGKMPKFKITGAMEVFLDGKVIAYELEGRRPKDKDDISVLVTADGKRIAIEDE